MQGKVSRVRKAMTERVVTVRNGKGLPIEIVLRADAEGAAFRYRFPYRGDGVPHTVASEATGLTLNVPADGGAQFTLPYTVQKPKYQEWYVPRDQHTIPALGDPTASPRVASFLCRPAPSGPTESSGGCWRASPAWTAPIRHVASPSPPWTRARGR
ncbi:glycoside hydrolase family 97 N-terminal domain-containing protein [Streptomyces sp. NPDC048581]|uniref:glycoside hydrolase family 97 N-terminal domain-containing protein n=1 Tax=unclassified Streptomyces TaxID=2593676 RepID=UPI003712916D